MRIWRENHRLLMVLSTFSWVTGIALLYTESYTSPIMIRYVHISASILIVPHLVINILFRKQNRVRTRSKGFTHSLNVWFIRLLTALIVIQLCVGIGLLTVDGTFDRLVFKQIHHYVAKTLIPTLSAHIILALLLL